MFLPPFDRVRILPIRNRYTQAIRSVCGLQPEESERIVAGVTADETVVARQVTEGTTDLEPELIQSAQLDDRDRFRWLFLGVIHVASVLLE